MNASTVQAGLYNVLQRAQEQMGAECPPLTPTTVPVKMLPKFDSKVWPAVTTWLERELGIVIPKTVHIFGVKGGKPPLSIAETVALVCKHGVEKSAEKVAAE